MVKKLKSPNAMLKARLDPLPNIDAIRAELMASNHSWWASAVGSVIAVLRDAGNASEKPNPPKVMDW